MEETHVRLREIVAGLTIAPGAAVLDVGCGTGVLLPLLRERNGNGHVVALDLSGEMLKRALGKGQPAIYVQGDAESLPLPEGIFDWVICNAVFPHFSDKSRALGELRRVLRAGGHLVICHTASRQAINEFHRSVGGVVAHDAIPGEGEMLPCCGRPDWWRSRYEMSRTATWRWPAGMGIQGGDAARQMSQSQWIQNRSEGIARNSGCPNLRFWPGSGDPGRAKWDLASLFYPRKTTFKRRTKK